MRNIWKLLTVCNAAGRFGARRKDGVSGQSAPDDGTTIINGHKAVDLGLSVKWASCNVGAQNAENLGCYFAWGETQGKKNYGWSKEGDYKWGRYDSIAKPKCGMTKYTADAEGGDGFKTLQAGNDPATANWGSEWRTPTYKEIEELLDPTKCKWTWDAGKKGYSVRGLKTDNSIFLPAAGYRYGLDLGAVGTIGRFWSSSVNESCLRSAHFFQFTFDSYGSSMCLRYFGLPVRAVTEYEPINQLIKTR